MSAIVSLGLDENDSKKTTLEVYRQYFEKPFVHATEVYYKMESEKFLSENSVTEYMKKVNEESACCPVTSFIGGFKRWCKRHKYFARSDIWDLVFYEIFLP
jgi:hypothetical protein